MTQSDARPPVQALAFDVFGTVVDWRGSVAREAAAVAASHAVEGDWEAFADAWRAGYAPAMDRVRCGSLKPTGDLQHGLEIEPRCGGERDGIIGDVQPHQNVGLAQRPAEPAQDRVRDCLGRARAELLGEPSHVVCMDDQAGTAATGMNERCVHRSLDARSRRYVHVVRLRRSGLQGLHQEGGGGTDQRQCDQGVFSEAELHRGGKRRQHRHEVRRPNAREHAADGQGGNACELVIYHGRGPFQRSRARPH